MNPYALILLYTLASCLAVGVIGTIVLVRARRASLTVILLVSSVIPLLGAIAAMIVIVQAMFVSAHDATVALLVSGIGLVISIIISIVIGRWLTRSSRSLSAAVARLAADVEAIETPDDASRTGARDMELPTGPMPSELRSVTDALVRSRRQLAESRERERAMADSRRQLIAFLSHDLKSPLAGIRAITEGLEDGVLTDIDGAHGDLIQASERMTKMVNDLSELSEVTGRKPDADAVVVDLAEIVDDVATEAEYAGRARGIVIEVHADDRLPVLARADELSRAVANLLDNALVHSPDNSAIRVDAWLDAAGQSRAAADRVCLSVQDAGNGIPESDRERIFDVGWRGEADRNPHSGGAGLGLAIVSQIVRSHSGTVSTQDADPGLRVDIRLPGA